jgi:hypothetical protein
VDLALGLWVECLNTPFRIWGGGSGFSIYKFISGGGGGASRLVLAFEEP